VVARFHQWLAPGGWLIVGVTETSQHLFPEFEAVHLRNATLYRKSARAVVANYSVLRTADMDRVCCDNDVDDNEAIDNEVLNHDVLNRLGPTTVPNAETASARISNARTAASNPRPAMEKHPIRPLPQGSADAASILILARQKAGQAELHSALALCEQALRADRMTVPGHYLRALILQEMGLPAEATRALHQSIYLDPEFVLGHFALGNLALQAGRRKESKKHFENVLLLLAHYRPEDTVPHSEGLPAGRLREIVISAGRQGGPMKERAAEPPSRGNFDLNT
jgi:chemotaxis protein methyltransferase CheR